MLPSGVPEDPFSALIDGLNDFLAGIQTEDDGPFGNVTIPGSEGLAADPQSGELMDMTVELPETPPPPPSLTSSLDLEDQLQACWQPEHTEDAGDDAGDDCMSKSCTDDELEMVVDVEYIMKDAADKDIDPREAAEMWAAVFEAVANSATPASSVGAVASLTSEEAIEDLTNFGPDTLPDSDDPGGDGGTGGGGGGDGNSGGDGDGGGGQGGGTGGPGGNGPFDRVGEIGSGGETNASWSFGAPAGQYFRRAALLAPKATAAGGAVYRVPTACGHNASLAALRQGQTLLSDG